MGDRSRLIHSKVEKRECVDTCKDRIEGVKALGSRENFCRYTKLTKKKIEWKKLVCCFTLKVEMRKCVNTCKEGIEGEAALGSREDFCLYTELTRVK